MGKPRNRNHKNGQNGGGRFQNSHQNHMDHDNSHNGNRNSGGNWHGNQKSFHNQRGGSYQGDNHNDGFQQGNRNRNQHQNRSPPPPYSRAVHSNVPNKPWHMMTPAEKAAKKAEDAARKAQNFNHSNHLDYPSTNTFDNQSNATHVPGRVPAEVWASWSGEQRKRWGEDNRKAKHEHKNVQRTDSYWDQEVKERNAAWSGNGKPGECGYCGLTIEECCKADQMCVWVGSWGSPMIYVYDGIVEGMEWE